ncbi:MULTISPECIES: glycosyltransferase 87 family protein [unclassified Arthrobacter]|uniref:glycosyltransferase 87 family protein n=1 Tax=unclassified Arthrobacter TaxID=235627 RepID=UPI001E56FBDC|nr:MULTISPECIES: glycosyltransferase 87 family protein [unclassified Arthrobacter]MCC9144518.1 glycosyltransferase 87 family protein [Arthrobacter sp. zg-Y919]MDK1275744.1 glycosyltransferase 87 family protein [Arthrobacter sp. zg.Y919]WIB02890.1 glycosyltransferase 87 family protein [Arthrobacter sp. zg-Y919]
MALSTADPASRTRTRILWLTLGLPVALVLVVVGAQIHGLDFTVYREGARAFLGLSGHQLYDPSLVQTDTRGLPFTYPPFAALLLTPFAVLPTALGLVLLTATSLACLVLTAFLVARYLQENKVLPARLHAVLGGNAGVAVLAALLIGVLGPWREGLGFGQINPMLMLLIVADLLRPASSKLPRGVLIGLAAGIKLTPLAFGLIFLVRRDWRAILTMGATFAATVAAGWLASPAQSRTFWLDSLFDSTRVGDTTDMYNVSLNSFIAHLGTREALQRPLWLLASAAVVVLGFLAIRRSDERGDTLAAISANAVVMLAISPISWFHHWVWIALVLPVLWVAVRRRRAGVRAGGIALLVVMVPVFMLSSVTVTMMLTGVVSGQGPVALELFTSLGVLLPVAALVYLLAAPVSAEDSPAPAAEATGQPSAK